MFCGMAGISEATTLRRLRSSRSFWDGISTVGISPNSPLWPGPGLLSNYRREIVSPAFFHEIERQVDIAQVSSGAEEAALFDQLVSVIMERRRTLASYLVP
jgi:hypothetical protein